MWGRWVSTVRTLRKSLLGDLVVVQALVAMPVDRDLGDPLAEDLDQAAPLDGGGGDGLAVCQGSATSDHGTTLRPPVSHRIGDPYYRRCGGLRMPGH
jgi:hypothetical protein